MNKYDVDYFIKKFEAIPEELWHDKGDYVSLTNDECKCALGHCGADYFDEITPEAVALKNIFIGGSVIDVNDGDDPRFQQPTAKQRILAALNEIKQTEGV